MVEIKDNNVMIDRHNFFDQLVKNVIRTYDNIRKMSTYQGDNYATGCFLDYVYFEKKLLTMDLSKQKTLNADSKAIQQINFTGNLVGSIQQYSSLLRNSEKDY